MPPRPPTCHVGNCTQLLDIWTSWLVTQRARVIFLERQGLAAAVSRILKKNHSLPSHCTDARCVERMRETRVAIRQVDKLVDRLDSHVEDVTSMLAWARSIVPRGRVLIVNYDDLAAGAPLPRIVCAYIAC